MMIRRFFFTLLWAILPIVFLIVLTIVPLVAMLRYESNGLMWRDVLTDGFYQRKFIWTLFQAACSSILCVILALPMGWSLARLTFFGKKWLSKLILLPFVMPTLVAGVGVLGLFGERGILWAGWQDTAYLLIYGNIFFNLPIAILAAQQGFQAVPANRLSAAQLLGATAWQRFYHIDLPVLKNWLWGAVCLIFLYCVSGFGLALLLGGQKYSTLEVEIYQLIAHELDMSRAAILVMMILLCCGVAGGLFAWFGRRSDPISTARKLPEKPNFKQFMILILSICIVMGFCFLPLAAVGIQAARQLSSQNVSVLWADDTLLALKNTLLFTGLSTVLACGLGLLHAMVARRWLWVRGLTFFPMMISPVCLAFGVLLVYSDWSDNRILLIGLYSLMAYPFVVKDILATWDTLPERHTQAAQIFGANHKKLIFHVILPILKPALWRGMTLAAATGIGEFAATLFLSRPEWLTLTTLIYQKLGKVGAENYHQAIVLTGLLMLMAVVVFLLLEQKQTD